MEVEMKTRLLEVLEMIGNDMANDARDFDGKPFTGRVVAEYFGNQGAAIKALANTLRLVIEDAR